MAGNAGADATIPLTSMTVRRVRPAVTSTLTSPGAASNTMVYTTEEGAMHVQVVTFALKGVTEEEYHEGCKDETSVFADLPGLIAKIWLRNPAANRYGAVYLWADKASQLGYVQGEVFQSIQNDPSLADVRSDDYEVYDDLTALTQPGLTMS